MNANYGADDAFDATPALRIAPAVTSRMTAFSDDMASYGASYAFAADGAVKAPNPFQTRPAMPQPVGGGQGKLPSPAPQFGTSNKTPAFGVSGSQNLPFPQGGSLAQAASLEWFPDRKSFLIRKQTDADELADILHPQQSLPHSTEGQIERWLSEVFQGNRGFELGTLNATILATAMRKQSAKWADISLGYVSDAIVIVHNFVISALESVCVDMRVRDALFERILEDLLSRYQKAITHAQFLLEVESEGFPWTMNHYFNDNLQKSRHERIASSLKKFTVINENKQEVITLKDALKSQNMSNDDHVMQDIHDILKAYYKVTRKTFVDNVCKLSTQHFLLPSAECPLKLFSPVYVSHLSAADLENIAGEALGARSMRESLKKEIASLANARKILARA